MILKYIQNINMTTAVLLVSEQTLPNVLFIRQFGPFDTYVILTTERMEKQGRSNWILDAANVGTASVQKLLIDPENANTAFSQLESFAWPPDTSFMVHVTGGTKMMALAVFSYFQSVEQVRILYLPLNAPHFIEIAPFQQQIPVTSSVTVEDYLKAYGVVLQAKNTNWRSLVSMSEEVMNVVLYKTKGTKAQEIRQLLQSQGQNNLSPEWRKFYLGEWFEIWLASKIATILQLNDDQIWVSAEMNNQNVIGNHISYEYDLVFIYKNTLYTAECKYYNQNRVQYSKLREPLFKYASVVVQFGLNARPFFAIANTIPFGIEKEDIKDRCKLLRLPFPAFINDIKDEKSLLNYLKNI